MEGDLAMAIITNNCWRDFSYRWEVPNQVLEAEFDWLNEEEASSGFIFYRGLWYHTSQFMRHAPEGWDGSHSDSFFSGIVIKLSDCGEQYKIGLYLADQE